MQYFLKRCIRRLIEYVESPEWEEGEVLQQVVEDQLLVDEFDRLEGENDYDWLDSCHWLDESDEDLDDFDHFIVHDYCACGSVAPSALGGQECYSCYTEH